MSEHRRSSILRSIEYLKGLLFLIAGLLLCMHMSCGGGQDPSPTPEGQERAATRGYPAVNPAMPIPIKVPTPPEITQGVQIKTSMGRIVIGLYGKAAPKTVENFLSYVDSGFYSDKIFHRVIPGFMIQGGGFDATLVRASADSRVALEIIPGFKHIPGTVSMARTSDPNSASSQFFICVASVPQLNGAYAAFGEVDEGMEVVNSISSVRTERVERESGVMEDVPTSAVMIESVVRLE